MGALSLDVATVALPFAEPFRISGYVFDSADAIVVTLADGDHVGRGEASGVYYLNDDVPAMCAQIEDVRARIAQGITREEVRSILPPGGARNAIDCALWELESAQAGRPAWELAGLAAPKPVVTTFTVSADTPDAMGTKAVSYTGARAIKVKLTGDLDLDIARIAAVRAARPDVWLGVDGNQGFDRSDLGTLIDALGRERVSLLEQPLARGREADLEGLGSPVPIAGDESLLSLADLAAAPGRFDVVNIKLDKCGGLTEGFAMAAEARRLGLGVMVGTMIGTSLSTAPAFLLAQLCDLVDLDGPTFLKSDPEPRVSYDDGLLWCGPEVWGSPRVTAA